MSHNNDSKRSIRAIISDLARSSIKADEIAVRLASHSSTDIPLDTVESRDQVIAGLKREVSRLRSLVAVLQDAIEDDEDLTDEQEASFLQKMNTVVEKLSLAEMQHGYSPEIMATYPTRLRYWVALALVNSCTTRGLPAEACWQDIVSKQGVM